MRKIFLFILLFYSVSGTCQPHFIVNGWKHATPAGMSILAFNTNADVDQDVTNTLSSVPAGSLLVLTIAYADDASQITATSVNSSPSLTWTKRVSSSANSSGTTEIWTATFTSGGSITTTATETTSLGSHLSGVLYSIGGSETTPAGATASQNGPTAQPSVSITTTRAGSLIFCVTSDWNAKSGTTTYRGAPTQTLRQFASGVSTDWHYYYQATTATAYTTGLTAPTGQASGTSVLEIRTP